MTATKKKRGKRVALPPLFRAFGFTPNAYGAERRVHIPNFGFMDLNLKEESFKLLKDSRKMAGAVAFLAFFAGRQSRDAEVAQLKSERDAKENSKQEYKNRLDSVTRLVVGSDYR